MLPALLKTVHLLGVVLWVGGMLFAHFFLRPSLALLEPRQRLALMHEVLRRFFAAVMVASVLVLASGFALVHVAAPRAGPAFAWPVDWLVMAVLGTLMVAIFVLIRFGPYVRFGRALAAGDIAAAAAQLARIRRGVGANLAIGVALIVIVLVV